MWAFRRAESGQLTPMVIGFVVIALLAVSVMVNASKAFLHRRSLAGWADGAAIVAAQSVADQAIYTGEVGENLPLAEDAAQAAVGEYVTRHGLGGRFDELTVVTEVDPVSDAVTVLLAAQVPLVLAADMAIPVTAQATAVAPLR